jgi:2-phospho-L-lactate guanylyltransferase
MVAASSGDRAQREAGCETPTIDPTAVPQDPAPITATRSLIALEPTAARDGLGVDPYTVSVSRATVPPPQDAAEAIDVRLGYEVVLIPVKAFHQAKRRLGTSLSDPDRIQLVRAMAAHVVAACRPLPVAVVCDDEEVAQWASGVGATVMWEPGQGLNGAVRAGVDRLARAGARWVTVAHGDLPRARGLGVLEPFEGVTLVPDRRDDGTNVLRLPAGSAFRFAYGPGSFRAHRAEATRLGLPVRVLRHPDLAYDVDWPADVAELGRISRPVP